MGKWTPVVKKETIARAKRAKELSKKGKSPKAIAKKIKRSVSRVWEYLKGEKGENWNSKK